MKRAILYILTVFLIGCSSNKHLLERSVKHYRADGGAYLLYDMQRDEMADKQSVNFNLQQKYQPDFSLIGLKGKITPEQLLREYVGIVKNNSDLLTVLRQNVISGEAKKAQVNGVEIFGMTTTTNKNQTKEVITTFLGHFIKGENTYAILILLDNPKPIKETYGFSSAGWNVVNIARDLITALTSPK
jgi:hypothetical protein